MALKLYAKSLWGRTLIIVVLNLYARGLWGRTLIIVSLKKEFFLIILIFQGKIEEVPEVSNWLFWIAISLKILRGKNINRV